MKLHQLFEVENRLTKYLMFLVKKAKDVVDGNGYVIDALTDCDIYPFGGHPKFVIMMPIFANLAQYDISQMFDGDRKLSRELRKRAAKFRQPNMDEFNRLKQELVNIVKVWIPYGLDTVRVATEKREGGWHPATSHPATEFDVDAVVLLNDHQEIAYDIFFTFRDDGSLDKE